MRKNLKPKAYIYPLPVLIVGTYDENGTPNAMNAAWGTVCDTAQVSICLDKNHKTVKNLLKTKRLQLRLPIVKTLFLPITLVWFLQTMFPINLQKQAGLLQCQSL